MVNDLGGAKDGTGGSSEAAKSVVAEIEALGHVAGDPDDFRFFVDYMHARGIGVILDWVPSHFPEDAHGLGFFDGSHLYEHPDRRKGYHPDWKSLIFNYGRNEVRNFLLSSAIYWLEEMHIDGLRVDARGARRKTLRGTPAEGWSSAPPGGAPSASVLTYAEVWRVDAPTQLPVFSRADSLTGSGADGLEGLTRYTTRAVRDGDDWVINGEKIYVTDGERSDTLVVWATLDKSLGKAAIKSFIVEKGTPGCEVTRLEHKMGIRASDTADAPALWPKSATRVGSMRPASSSYRTVPNENTSERASAASPRACSGDM